MKHTFSLVDWDDIPKNKIYTNTAAQGATTNPIAHVAQKIDKIQCGPDQTFGPTNSVIQFDQFNVSLAREYADIRRATPAISSAVFNLNDFVAVGACGLILDINSKLCVVGENFGWHPQFAKWWSQNEMNAQWASDLSEFSVEWNFDVDYVDIDKCTFISQPGQDIYGHWILDLIPRLSLLRTSGFSDTPLAIGHIPNWARSFLELAQINSKQLNIITQKNVRIKSRVFVPSFLKSGFTIDSNFCRDSWSLFRSNLRLMTEKLTRQSFKKVFVSRAKWGSERPIQNMPQLEILAEKNGYQIVHPEKMSLLEQYILFSDARIIIGEDGSGLHNIVMCESRNVTLGVLGTSERTNMWHLSICDALNYKIAYLQATELEPGNHVIDDRSFLDYLDVLDSAYGPAN